MRILTNLLENRHVDFIKHRRVFYALSILLMAAILGGTVFKGLNYGIDFKGGILMEARTPEVADLASMRKALHGQDLGEVSLQQYGSPNPR